MTLSLILCSGRIVQTCVCSFFIWLYVNIQNTMCCVLTAGKRQVCVYQCLRVSPITSRSIKNGQWINERCLGPFKLSCPFKWQQQPASLAASGSLPLPVCIIDGFAVWTAGVSSPQVRRTYCGFACFTVTLTSSLPQRENLIFLFLKLLTWMLSSKMPKN